MEEEMTKEEEVEEGMEEEIEDKGEMEKEEGIETEMEPEKQEVLEHFRVFLVWGATGDSCTVGREWMWVLVGGFNMQGYCWVGWSG